MYIGAWPELHLAKLVAAAQLGQGSSDGGRTADDNEQRSACDTPASAASGASDGLWNVPICRRVDIADSRDISQSAGRRKLEIGPRDLPEACRSRSESKRSCDRSALPPVSRGQSGTGSRAAPGHTGRTPSKLLRSPASSRRSTSLRAQSQPRLWQLQLQGDASHQQPPAVLRWDQAPGSSAGGAPTSATSTSAPPPPRMPKAGSSPPTPPGVSQRPPLPGSRPDSARSSQVARTPPPRLPSVNFVKADGSIDEKGGTTPRRGGSGVRAFSADVASGTASRRTPGMAAAAPIPCPPMLSDTPPWAQKGSDERISGRFVASEVPKPAWLRDLRASVELSRGQFADAEFEDMQDRGSSASPRLRKSSPKKSVPSSQPSVSSSKGCGGAAFASTRGELSCADAPGTPVKLPAGSAVAPVEVGARLADCISEDVVSREVIGEINDLGLEVGFAPDPHDEELIAWSQALCVEDLADLQDDNPVDALSIFAP